MKKLSLNLEDLVVEGFSTTPAEKGKGTVMGHSHETCFLSLCPGDTCETCWETCAESCEGTCHDYTCRSCDATCWEWDCPSSSPCP